MVIFFVRILLVVINRLGVSVLIRRLVFKKINILKLVYVNLESNDMLVRSFCLFFFWCLLRVVVIVE